MNIIIQPLLIVFLLTAAGLDAADLDSRVKEREIKSSGAYRWGEASDADPAKAEEAAMRDLAKKIYVALATSTGRKTVETEGGVADTTRIETATYSALQLTGLDKLRFVDNGGTRVVVFLDTASLSRSFDLARRKTRDLAAQAFQAENEARIGDALRSFYWAYLTTFTYFGDDTLDLGGGASSGAQASLAEKINSVIRGLTAEAEPCYREAGAVTARIRFNYRGRPARSLDFKYYNGDGDDQADVRDGTAFITLYVEPSCRRYPLALGIEYAYPVEMHRRNPEIENLYRILGDRGFDCETRVDLVVPWAPEAPPTPPAPPSAIQPPSSVAPPEPLRPPRLCWPATIQVLSGISDSREFRQALDDYACVGRIIYAVRRDQLVGAKRIYSALLDEQRVYVLLCYDCSGLIDVRSGKVYGRLEDAFKGEARQIWIGEPAE